MHGGFVEIMAMWSTESGQAFHNRRARTPTRLLISEVWFSGVCFTQRPCD